MSLFDECSVYITKWLDKAPQLAGELYRGRMAEVRAELEPYISADVIHSVIVPYLDPVLELVSYGKEVCGIPREGYVFKAYMGPYMPITCYRNSIHTANIHTSFRPDRGRFYLCMNIPINFDDIRSISAQDSGVYCSDKKLTAEEAQDALAYAHITYATKPARDVIWNSSQSRDRRQRSDYEAPRCNEWRGRLQLLADELYMLELPPSRKAEAQICFKVFEYIMRTHDSYAIDVH